MTSKQDFTGQRFGMLTVIRVENPKPYRKKTYLCKCDCGNTCVRKAMSLHAAQRDGRISSCGCYTKKYLTAGDHDRCKKAGEHRKDSFVNDCNVQMTLREGTIKTNTSGHQGVSWSKSAHKWHCFIGYKSYRANLGYFEDESDAIRIRELAETAIKENRFEDFYFELRGHHLGEKQTKQVKKKGEM